MSDVNTSTAGAQAVQHQDCVTEAITDVFSCACGVDLQLLEDGSAIATDGVIIALISLVGDVEWSVFLGLPRSTATAVAEKFAGFAIPFESSDMGDAIGEMTNIFAGRAKAILDQRNVTVEISLPSVIWAKSIEVLVQHNSAINRHLFESELGRLWTGVVVGNGGVLVL